MFWRPVNLYINVDVSVQVSSFQVELSSEHCSSAKFDINGSHSAKRIKETKTTIPICPIILDECNLTILYTIKLPGFCCVDEMLCWNMISLLSAVGSDCLNYIHYYN